MKEKLRCAEAAYVLGIVLCALGVALSAKSGFGVSMVVAPAYVLHKKLVSVLDWFSFGVAEYVLQGVLLLGLSLFLRRVKGKFLLSFITALFYGGVLDLWRTLLGTATAEGLSAQIGFAVAGAVVTSFSIALLLNTYLPQQAYELVVKELSDRLGRPVSRVKLCYDACSLFSAILLMLCLFGGFDPALVGVGTLVLTLVNAPMIALFSRLLCRAVSFESAVPSFYERFQARFD